MSWPILILNLERSIDRKRFMETQLKALKLTNYTFIPAIDGKVLRKAERTMLCKTDTLTPSEVGCYLSHYQAYKHMLKEGIEAALILEDDIHISADTPQLLANSHCFPPHWHLIHVANNEQDETPFTFINPWTIHRVYKTYRLARSMSARTRAHAYFIHQRGIAQFMPFLFPIQQPIDMLLFSTKQTRFVYPFFLLSSPLSSLSNYESTIEGRESKEKKISLTQHLYRRSRKYVRWIECCVYCCLPPHTLHSVFITFAHMKNILGKLTTHH